MDPGRLLPVCVRTLDGRARWYSQAKIEAVTLTASQEQKIRAEIAKAAQDGEAPESSAYAEAAAVQAAVKAQARQASDNLKIQAASSAGMAEMPADTVSPVQSRGQASSEKQPQQPPQKIAAQGGVSLLDGFAISAKLSNPGAGQAKEAAVPAKQGVEWPLSTIATVASVETVATASENGRKEMTAEEYDALFRSELQAQQVQSGETYAASGAETVAPAASPNTFDDEFTDFVAAGPSPVTPAGAVDETDRTGTEDRVAEAVVAEAAVAEVVTTPAPAADAAQAKEADVEFLDFVAAPSDEVVPAPQVPPAPGTTAPETPAPERPATESSETQSATASGAGSALVTETAPSGDAVDKTKIPPPLVPASTDANFADFSCDASSPQNAASGEESPDLGIRSDAARAALAELVSVDLATNSRGGAAAEPAPSAAVAPSAQASAALAVDGDALPSSIEAEGDAIAETALPAAEGSLETPAKDGIDVMFDEVAGMLAAVGGGSQDNSVAEPATAEVVHAGSEAIETTGLAEPAVPTQQAEPVAQDAPAALVEPDPLSNGHAESQLGFAPAVSADEAQDACAKETAPEVPAATEPTEGASAVGPTLVQVDSPDSTGG